MRKAHALTVVLLLLAGTRTVFPQSLGDLARKEEERRKTIKTPSKVYTNDDLKRDPGGTEPTSVSIPGPTASTPMPAGSAASPASPPPEEAPKTEAPPPPAPARTEAYWKSRMADARSTLDRSKTLQEALKSRVSALTTDFTNRDDPAQRAAIDRERQKALTEITRLDKEIQDQTKAIVTIEEEARRSNVPAGWLR